MDKVINSSINKLVIPFIYIYTKVTSRNNLDDKVYLTTIKTTQQAPLLTWEDLNNANLLHKLTFYW